MAAKKFPVFGCLGALLLVFAMSCQIKDAWRTSALVFFDTMVEIELCCAPGAFQEAVRSVSSSFEEIEALFSPGEENLSSPLVLQLHAVADGIYQNSGGCFDITVEPLSRLWGFRDKDHRVPSEEEIRSALSLVGMDRIRRASGHLVLLPDTEIDWGGIAKGFAVDLAATRLVERGFERGLINAGGDLYCWGTNPENSLWRVGVKHPRGKGFVGILSLSGTAAATTGDYLRYFERSGQRYHHIFDPRTGYPARGKQSVTVIGPEALVCDALATAIFVCGCPEEILRHYSQYGAVIVSEKGEILLKGKIFPFERTGKDETRDDSRP